MAQAMASMAGLRGSSQAVLEGSFHLNGPNRLTGAPTSRLAANRHPLSSVRSQHVPAENEASGNSSRRATIGLVAAVVAGGSFAKAVLAVPKSIKVGPPPLPSGGLPGTENSDEARDFELPLKERFYLQPLSADKAVERAKESAKEIIDVKKNIDKKAWPYVQNDLRLRASYLRYDLNTIISAKPKEEKKSLKELTGKLFSKINDLDHAAKIKSSEAAEKYYAETKSALDDVLAKIG